MQQTMMGAAITKYMKFLQNVLTHHPNANVVYFCISITLVYN